MTTREHFAWDTNGKLIRHEVTHRHDDTAAPKLPLSVYHGCELEDKDCAQDPCPDRLAELGQGR